MQCNELNNKATRCATPAGEIARTEAREETGAWFRAPVDVIETEDHVIVRADVPGVAPKDVGVHVRGDTLELHAPVHRPVPEGARVFLAEYGVGDWRRSLRLAPTIDREGIAARCTDGVLEVRLPKRREAQRRRIEVRSN
jgi:HSP20 family protein